MCAPETVLGAWTDELESAAAERRHVTFTMHPEVVGRGQRMCALERLIAAAREHGGAFASHGEVAAVAVRSPAALGDPIRIVA
jgi:peptidoglycan/xylan/chitin deacetylase (PgdA/CDA1 family)